MDLGGLIIINGPTKRSGKSVYLLGLSVLLRAQLNLIKKQVPIGAVKILTTVTKKMIKIEM